ncbi:MAG: DNA-processing protein DprA [Bacteroidales bacterium]|nr:DNA-processing protein DprA [Bacteroidales bacterium]
MENLQIKIALSMIPSLGPRLVRKLVSYAGGIETVFNNKRSRLAKIPGIGEIKAARINGDKILKAAEAEIDYMSKNNIIPLFYLDKEYPLRLRECEDAPIVLYVKGDINFNISKVISIVGTRHSSSYGRVCTEEIITYLAECFPELVVVSGLAFGIDITAHKAALNNGLKTIAALGHGFDFIYPAAHKYYTHSIEKQGALVTEFRSTQKPEPGNFVSRNRIIAGLADATVVIESAEKGGALITADLANSYNREVFAVPGKTSDTYSKGCNQLIKQNKAALIECGADIELAMGWFKEKCKPQSIQKSLFVNLSDEEKLIYNLLKSNGEMPLDEISVSLELPVAKVSASLLNMEFNGLLRLLPGKMYKCI